MTTGSANDRAELDRRNLTPEEFLDKLKRALMRNGDFPASAKIVTELRMLTNDPQTTANQIAEVILREPSLGVRVLHLVNSSYYKRAKPITTITQAIVQIGMKPLAEMCAGLVLLQRFVPEARQNSAFALCLRKSIATSFIASSLANHAAEKKGLKASKNGESGYLAGTMSEIGLLLVAYYFPQVYDSALKRAETKKQELSTSLKQIIGLSPAQLSMEVIRTLNLPQFYGDIVLLADRFMESPNSSGTNENTGEVAEISRCLGAAITISDAASSTNDPARFMQQVHEVQRKLGFGADELQSVINALPQGLQEFSNALEVALPPIQMELETFVVGAPSNGDNIEPSSAAKLPEIPDIGEHQEEFQQYVNEIKLAISNCEPTANIVTSVMEACAYCLKFDRVLLLLANQGRRSLIGRMMLGGDSDFDPTKFARPLGENADTYAPDNNAFMHGRPVFQGDPLFKEGWPIAAIPVGSGKRAVGVVYAERIGGSSELSPPEQAAVVLLANLLDKSLQKTASGISQNT